MAVRKPLVIDSGLIQQLQSGDQVEGGLDDSSYTNGEASSISICQAVYVSGADTVQLAQADSVSTSKVIGLVFDSSISSSASGRIQRSGTVEATTGEWDAVTGGAGGLSSGSEYYLSPSTAGGLTATAPSTVGQVVAPIGIAKSTTELELNIKSTVLL